MSQVKFIKRMGLFFIVTAVILIGGFFISSRVLADEATALLAVNSAINATSTQTALEVNAIDLGILVGNPSDYFSLASSTKITVATAVLANKPIDTFYTTTAAVKAVFDLAVAKAKAHGTLTTTLAGYVEANYTPSNWTSLNKYKTDGDINIDAAGSTGAVTSAKNTATVGMAGVETKAAALAAVNAAAGVAVAAYEAKVALTYTSTSFAAIEKASAENAIAAYKVSAPAEDDNIYDARKTAADSTNTTKQTTYNNYVSAKSITAFSFSSGIGVINETGGTIMINVPFGTDVTNLVATFATTTGESVSVSGVPQTSATTTNNFSSPIVYTVTAINASTKTYMVTVNVLGATQIAPNGSGAATVNNTTPQVVITNPSQAATVTISSGTTNPKINVSSFITGGTGTLPRIDITSANANNATVAISDSTLVTSADITWDGVIAAPTVTTVDLPVVSGETKTLSTAIEVGFTGAKLSFDKAVRILLPDQAGKRVGYIRTGTAFTEITSTCVADNQATGDALAVDGDCKIDVGSDLVIWTKHFTSFATYTQTTNSGGGGGGGGGSGGGGSTIVSAPADITAPTTVSVVINGGEDVTANREITLTLSANDASAIQMMISDSPAFSDGSWENYNATKLWSLSGGNGIKTIYVKFKDTYNNISDIVYDSIILDTSNAVKGQKSESKVLGEKVVNPADSQLVQILADSSVIFSENIETILTNAKSTRDQAKEKNTADKYLSSLTHEEKNLSSADANRLNWFVTYGTVATKVLGAGERAGVLNSYKEAFGKLPKTETEWEDAIKIASGRWPSVTSATAETKAKASFKKIYGKEADMNNQNENAAVTIMAYGLRPSARNLNSEKTAILSFKYFYKYMPVSANDWDAVRAIAYSGAKK